MPFLPCHRRLPNVPRDAGAQQQTQLVSKRSFLLAVAGAATLGLPPIAVAEDPEAVRDQIALFSDKITSIQQKAEEAYSKREFRKAVDLFSELIYQQPNNPDWSERRGQVLIDCRNFSVAIMDYNQALQQTDRGNTAAQARLTNGRALALEGDGDFKNALADYTRCQEMTLKIGQGYDPYTTFSIGNCQAALGDYQGARNSYNLAGRLFDAAQDPQYIGKTNAARLNGAVYAHPNAAAMLVQLGDIDGAQTEFEEIAARGGPASVDANVSLAAIYHNKGREDSADACWRTTCRLATRNGSSDDIASAGDAAKLRKEEGDGCVYRQRAWIDKTRRWPPKMQELFGAYITLTEEGST